MRFLSKKILSCLGWKVRVDNSFQGVKQSVIMMAPHTSNWDFFYTYLGIRSVGVPFNFLIKDSFFFFPLDRIIRKMGGIPVNRKSKSNMVEDLSARFKTEEIVHLGVSVEGTRSYTEKWRSGGYYVAYEANVPLFLGYIDFAEKEVGIGDVLDPSGAFEEDVTQMEAFYRHKTPKYPGKFNLTPDPKP